MLRISLIFLMIIFFVNCEQVNIPNQHNVNISVDFSSNYNITLERIGGFTIDNNSEVRLDRMKNIVAFNHREDRIAWVNDDINRIFVTDNKGNLICAFGSSGRGPEEFLEVSIFGFNSKDHVIVYDARQAMFKQFDDNCNFVQTVAGLEDSGIWLLPNLLFTSKDNRIYVGAEERSKANERNFWKSKTIAVFDYNLNLQKVYGDFDPDLEGGSYLYSFPIVTYNRPKGQIYTMHRTAPTIQIYDEENGKFIGRFGLKSGSFSEPEDRAKLSDPMHIRRQKNLEQSFVGQSFVSENYFFFQHYRITEELLHYSDPFLRNSYFNIYDINNQYKFLGELQLHHLALYVSRAGKIYLLEDNDPDNFKIGIYELKKSEI